MERREEQVSLTTEYRCSVVLGEHLDRRADPLDHGRPNEDASERAARELTHGKCGFERLALAAVAVPAHRDVEHPKRLLVGATVDDFLGAENEPGAGRERRETVTKLVGERLS